ARRRHLTRTRSHKHDLAHRASAYEYCVVGAFNRGQQVMGGHKHRLCADVETAFAAASETYQLDAIAKLLRHLDVQIGDSRYALAVNRVAVYKLSESERGENCDLVRDVEALDVVCRVGFGISQPLCVLERFFKALTARVHRGQYVVCSAVENSCD